VRSFLRRHAALFVALAVLASWLALFPRWADQINAAPLDTDIGLSPREPMSREIRIVVPENYRLVLVFERSDMPLAQLQALIGGWSMAGGEPAPSGIRIPVRWTLREMPGGRLAAAGEVDSAGASGWSATRVYRDIGHVRVAPGRYRFSAQVMRDVPELAQLHARVSMRLAPKAGSTWQVGAAWWGSLATLFLAWPIAIGLALVLLARAWSGIASGPPGLRKP
jgi:hypothetical protein